MGIDLFLRLAGRVIVSLCLGGTGTRRRCRCRRGVRRRRLRRRSIPKPPTCNAKAHAAALTSPEVISAITGNYRGCISIVYFEWSSPGRTRVVLPWTKICGLQDARKRPLA